MTIDDTIAALATPIGPGRRAIVRITGPQTKQILNSVCTADFRPGCFTETFLKLSNIHSPLPAHVLVRVAPHTYTGQDLAEIHTVSSPPLLEILFADLLAAGARAARPGEFTQRAFLSGKKDLTRAEAVRAVIAAGTDADLKPALAQLAGGVARPLDQLRSDLLDLLADVEAALDFADEHIEFVSKPKLLTRIAAGIAHLVNLRRQVADRAVSGRAVRVVLAGKPNAGKSTLFNALVGESRAIVSAVAGTTRDYLSAEMTIAGVPVELIDTAGWATPTDTIEAGAQELGRGQTQRADVVLWCAAPGDTFESDTTFEMSMICVSTQADRVNVALAPGGIPTSVVTQNGLDRLKAELTGAVESAAQPPLAPSISRCKNHIEQATAALQRAHRLALEDDPPELLAAELRHALDQIGETAGAIHTPDLLDKIFSRFCIGK